MLRIELVAVFSVKSTGPEVWTRPEGRPNWGPLVKNSSPSPWPSRSSVEPSGVRVTVAGPDASSVTVTTWLAPGASVNWVGLSDSHDTSGGRPQVS